MITRTLIVLMVALTVTTGCSDDGSSDHQDARVSDGTIPVHDGTSPDQGGGMDLGQGDTSLSDLGQDGTPADGPISSDGQVQPASLPPYGAPTLMARTNLVGNPGGAYNLPEGYLFSGEDVQLNNNGLLCFRLTVTPQITKDVWCGTVGSSGSLVYSSPTGAFMLPLALNDTGRVVFELADVTTPGLYFYDNATQTSGFQTGEPIGAQARSGLSINNQGVLAFAARFGAGGAHVTVDGNTVTYYVKETGLDPTSPYSYLFGPDFSESGQLASAARKGPDISESQPDEIRLWNADGSSTLIVQDTDADPTSSYTSFDATRVSINNHGQVAFVATLTSGERAVVVADGQQSRTIASEADPQISEIEYFGAAINDGGLVVFRARDSAGLQCIFIGNGTDLKCLVKEHDTVTIDQGQARIDQHDATYPVFGGKPGINADGDVVFNAGVTPVNDPLTEWGTAVFVLQAP